MAGDMQQYLQGYTHDLQHNLRIKNGSICPSECSLLSNDTPKHVCRPYGLRWREKGFHVTGNAQTE